MKVKQKCESANHGSAAELDVDSYRVFMIEIEMANLCVVIRRIELVPFDVIRNLVGSEQEIEISLHSPAH